MAMPCHGMAWPLEDQDIYILYIYIYVCAYTHIYIYIYTYYILFLIAHILHIISSIIYLMYYSALLIYYTLYLISYMLAYVIFYIFSAQAGLLSPRCTLIFKRIMPCHVCGNWMGPPGVPPWAFPVVFPSWPYLHQSPNGCWLWSERCGGWICLCTMVCYRKWCRADLHHRQSTGGG